MNFYPNFSHKMLSQTVAGELIYFSWGDPSLALIGFSGTARVLIFMRGRAVQHGPVYLVPKTDAKVVSYGTGYTFEIDQNPAFIDMHENSYWDVAGAIWVTQSQRLLYASAMPETGTFGTLQYDLETGQITSRSGNSTGVHFGKWKLWLPLEGSLQQQAHKPIFEFSTKPIKGFDQ